MKAKGQLDSGESRNRRGRISVMASDGEAVSNIDRKAKRGVAEELIDELSDYICGHVTRSLRPVQAAIEKKFIIEALREAGGNQKKAARILGLKYTTFIYKVKKHNIQISKVIMADHNSLFDAPEWAGEKG